jgi:hypothetical protein
MQRYKFQWSSYHVASVGNLRQRRDSSKASLARDVCCVLAEHFLAMSKRTNCLGHPLSKWALWRVGRRITWDKCWDERYRGNTPLLSSQRTECFARSRRWPLLADEIMMKSPTATSYLQKTWDRANKRHVAAIWNGLERKHSNKGHKSKCPVIAQTRMAKSKHHVKHDSAMLCLPPERVQGRVG